MAYPYRPAVIEALAAHGVRPTPATRPELVHEFVNDLYRFELRRLRARQVRGEIPKHEYSRHGIALRRRYLLVSLPLRRWTADREPAPEGERRRAPWGSSSRRDPTRSGKA